MNDWKLEEGLFINKVPYYRELAEVPDTYNNLISLNFDSIFINLPKDSLEELYKDLCMLFDTKTKDIYDKARVDGYAKGEDKGYKKGWEKGEKDGYKDTDSYLKRAKSHIKQEERKIINNSRWAALHVAVDIHTDKEIVKFLKKEILPYV